MNVIDEAVSKAKTAADFTAKKASELVEITKANLKIMDTQNTIDKAYQEIGKMVFEASKGNGEFSEEIDEKIAVIDELKLKLAELKDTVATLKGIIRCTSCGKENANENTFCGGCGANLRG